MTTTLPRPTEAPDALTTREHLAALAWQGLLAGGGRTPNEAARAAFTYADAFIRECEKQEDR